MKRIVLLLILGLLSNLTTSWAQDIARLVILSESDQKPLTDVICKAYDNTKTLKAYRLSNSKGEVQLSVTGLSYLVCSKLGYKPRHIDLKADNKQITVYLQEQVTELKQVVVKAKAIRQEGDTISYNANRFIGQSDRYLEDLIAKMPGLSIDASGRIRYQGEYIKRMYVEGKDMLGSDYSIATKALPAEGIAQVQVLENHQHIRRLKGKVHEERASINIKLKNSHKNRLIGDLTLGLSSLTPLGGLVEAKLSHFGSKYQGLYVPQSNNIGKAYERIGGQELNLNNVEVYDVGGDFIGGDSYRSLSELALSRYLDNRSLSSTMSGLLGLDSIRTLKYNARGVWDNRRQTNNERHIFGGAVPIHWERSRNYGVDDKGLSLKIIYEQNSMKKYLTNELRYDYQLSRSLTDVSVNSLSYQQRSEQAGYNIENTLSTSIPFGGRDVIYKSLLQYYALPEEFAVQGSDNALFSLEQGGLIINNHLSTLWALPKGTLSIGLTERYKHQHYRAKDLTSDLSRLEFSLNSSYTHHYGRGLWSISLSPKIERVWTNGVMTAEQTSARALYTLDPRLLWKQELSSKLQLSLQLSRGAKLFVPSYPLLGTLRTSYWNYRDTSRDIYSSTTWESSLNLNYKDLYRGIFGRVNASYRLREQDYILNRVYDATKYSQSYRHYDNQSKLWVISAGVDKSWADAGLTLKYDVTYQQGRYSIMQNTTISEAMNEHLTHSLKGILRANDVISARAELEHSHWRLHNNLYQTMTTSLSLVKARAYIDVEPSKAWQCKLGVEGYWNEVGRGIWEKGVFFDFSTTYKINKQLEFALVCTNLLGRKTYSIEYIQDLNSEVFAMPLRGRELLFKLNYRL